MAHCKQCGFIWNTRHQSGTMTGVLTKNMGCMLYVLLCNDSPLVEMKYDISTNREVVMMLCTHQDSCLQ